jgi:hypothetical protein
VVHAAKSMVSLSFSRLPPSKMMEFQQFLLVLEGFLAGNQVEIMKKA